MGVRVCRYYQLSVELFKTSLDTQLINLLWSKYWVNTLTSSPLIAVRCVFLFFFLHALTFSNRTATI